MKASWKHIVLNTMQTTTALFYAAAAGLILISNTGSAQDGAKTPSLQEQIEARSAQSGTKADPAKKKAYADGIEAVAASGVVDRATKKGDHAPDFTLPNATGKSITLSEELKKGPVVLTWYRGGWCPYCNLQLAAYQAVLPEIEKLGATLIAVSPELPDRALSTTEKNELKFQVLSDQDQKVAEKYNLIFKLTPEVAGYYKAAFDLNTFNGESAAADELPLAATYVINTDGKITYSFLDANYKKRAEPEAILQALAELKNKD
ncbi:MAG: AhpC/TSA family protein [Verrucomicrobiales bacterium]|jgi:peroxiredoxin|nr:AhpC/TSA family protein [Verrucomicrobiales bacterium]HQZ28549.1 peroxiredoxin-like family protein [Verrucomicrobiales bacterium]